MSIRAIFPRILAQCCVIALVFCAVLVRFQVAYAANEPRLLEGIARLAIPTLLSYVLEVRTSVGEVKIDLDAGSLAVNDLEIGNPNDFGDKPAFHFKQIRVEADIKSLYTETPIIHQIEVSGGQARVMTNRHGNNIKRLIASANRMNRPQDENRRQNEKQDPNAQTKWRIERAVMKDCVVDIITDLGLKETQHKVLDPIDLDLKGSDGAGLTADVALTKVLNAILEKINLNSIMGIPLPMDLIKSR